MSGADGDERSQVQRIDEAPKNGVPPKQQIVMRFKDARWLAENVDVELFEVTGAMAANINTGALEVDGYIAGVTDTVFLWMSLNGMPQQPGLSLRAIRKAVSSYLKENPAPATAANIITAVLNQKFGIQIFAPPPASDR